jgi:beta-1,4-mannosyltransferase
MLKEEIVFYPYGSEKNPYQYLIRNAILNYSKNKFDIKKITGKKWFPYSRFEISDIQIIHHFWPHDFYQGRNKISEILKQFSYRISLKKIDNKILIYNADNLVGHDYNSFNKEIYWIQKLVIKAKAIIFTSIASKEIFLKFYNVRDNCELVIVPHIDYTSFYSNNISTKEARIKLSISSDSKVVLSLGRVAPYKGTLDLIRSFLLVNKPNSVLIIAGKCTDLVYEKKIKTEILKAKSNNLKIIFINKFIEDNELQNYFNAADGVMLNYKDVPMNPGSVILSMGFGCSIIAPREGAIPEIVPKECLFGFDSKNLMSLESALLSFFECGNLVDLGEIAKKHVHENHSSEKVGKILSELYDKLIIESKLIN